jgi:hypothetical protein
LASDRTRKVDAAAWPGKSHRGENGDAPPLDGLNRARLAGLSADFTADLRPYFNVNVYRSAPMQWLINSRARFDQDSEMICAQISR